MTSLKHVWIDYSQ